MDKVELHGNKLSVFSPAVKFDFGGVIKGIAIDHVVKLLREAGCKSALIQIGGETAVFGVSARGKRHILGIQHPRDLNKIWGTVADSENGVSLSTSGNYQNKIIIAGEEFYHIVNPKTGWPVDTNILSVSILFPMTGYNWLADGLSTAGAVLGAEKAIPIIEGLHGEALFLISEDGRIREVKTSGWDQSGETIGQPSVNHLRKQ
jgi:FAD:protein FMN transferase